MAACAASEREVLSLNLRFTRTLHRAKGGVGSVMSIGLLVYRDFSSLALRQSRLHTTCKAEHAEKRPRAYYVAMRKLLVPDEPILLWYQLLHGVQRDLRYDTAPS